MDVEGGEPGIPEIWQTCLNVYLNTGQGFEAQAGNPIPARLSVVINGQTAWDILDVSGDGLPDQVAVGLPPQGTGTWFVRLNQGGRFDYDDLPDITWLGLSGPIRQRRIDGASDTITDMVDLDGDGLLDRIETGTAPARTCSAGRA